MSDRVETVCPCCNTKLVVDTENGDILSEERPKISSDKNFDTALGEVRAGATKREKAFAEAFDKTRRQDDLLEKKFEEARKKAGKDKARKPFSPFDLD